MIHNSSGSCHVSADDKFGPVVDSCRDDFDFTLLFEQALLSLLPAATVIILAVVTILRLWKRSVKTAHGKQTSWRRVIGPTALLCFGATQMALIVLWTRPSNGPTQVSVASSAVALFLAMTLSVLFWVQHSRSLRPPGLLTLYLLLSILLDVAQARTLWLRPANTAVAAVFTLGLAVKVSLVPLVMMEKRSILKMPYSELPPEEIGGVVNRGVFWWINSLLIKGSSNELQVDDLFDLDRDLTLARLMSKIRKVWCSGRRGRAHALLLAVLACFSRDILIIFAFRFALIGFRFCQPLLVNRAISLLLERDSQSKTNTGRALIGATALVYIGIALTTGTFQHTIYRLITKIRGSLVGMIYEKTLVIDASLASDSAALTLMSTDVERIANGFEFFDALWASPIEIAIAMALLYREVKLAFIVPVIFSIVFILIPVTLKGQAASAQTAWVASTERRVATMATVLPNMKGIKMSGLSRTLGDHIQALRVLEMKISSRFRTVLSASLSVSIMSQVITPYATLVAHRLIQGKESQRFDTTNAFTTLTLVALLANPIRDIARAVPECSAAASCLQRIQEYLSSEELDQRQSDAESAANFTKSGDVVALARLPAAHDMGKTAKLLEMKNASFCMWSMEEPVLSDITLSLTPGSWTILTGPIGCGKSMLLLALANELRLLRGSVHVRPLLRMGYCAQDPWLPNLSIRDIITSGTEFNEDRYWEVVDACLLRRDMSELSAGDSTVIGSNGVSLSGGQKQRLSLARALYSSRSLLLLDDVLGGLDASTEEALVNNVFRSNGYLQKHNTASVLVSHSWRHARRADHVIVMGNCGTIVEQGPPDTLTRLGELNDGRVVDSTLATNAASSAQPSAPSNGRSRKPDGGESSTPDAAQELKSELSRQTGDVRLYTYYLKALGWPSAVGIIIFVTSFAVFFKIPTVWVRWWAESEMSNPGAESDRYIGLYGLICGLSMISFVACFTLLFQYAIPRSSNHLHEKLVRALMNAPYWFLVSTDTGQIASRFSQDMSLLCSQLPFAFIDTLFNVSVCVVGTILIMLASKYSLAMLPGLVGMLYVLQKFYLRTSRQIRLLDLEAKSPIYSHFMETLKGLATIRAFGWQHRCRVDNETHLNRSQRPFYLMYCIQRWLNLVLDMMVAVVAIIIVSLATQLNGSSSGALGVSLLNIVTFSLDLTYLIRTWTELETSLGAIARIKDFERTTPSEHLPGETDDMAPSWPLNGKIVMAALSSGYSKDSQLILKQITLDIQPGEMVGICGRTGSGKSTLLLTLLRMAEIRDGDILVDGKSIQRIPRNDLRNRLFAMPQDPLFIPGSVRYNIDPFSHHEDEEIRSALDQVGMLHVITERGGLDANMSTITLSKGQQQLFCLTRAVLSKAKVVLLDEITSSVDSATEAEMMRVVEKVFPDRTILAIAHRLHTIRRFDKIVVMDHGRVLETGSPEALLARRGAFWKLWEDSMASSKGNHTSH